MTNGILLTRHNQEIAQWSPDPFLIRSRGWGLDTRLITNLVRTFTCRKWAWQSPNFRLCFARQWLNPPFLNF